MDRSSKPSPCRALHFVDGNFHWSGAGYVDQVDAHLDELLHGMLKKYPETAEKLAVLAS